MLCVRGGSGTPSRKWVVKGECGLHHSMGKSFICALATLIALCTGSIYAPNVAGAARDGMPLSTQEAFALGAAWVFDDSVRAGARSLVEGAPGVQHASEVLSFVGGPVGLPMVVASLWLADAELGQSALNRILATGAVTYAVKVVVGRPRPFTGERGLRGIEWLDEFHSFPSGHASLAFAAAGAISEKRPEWSEEAYGMALVIAASRVLLDQHWLSDVIAGAILGNAIGEGRFGWSLSW